MSNSRESGKFIRNNRGASLLVVLAAFVVLLVVAMNVIMLVSAGNRTALQEYETEQTQLYVSSAYSALNEKMLAGTWKDAFVDGQTVTIEVTGFKDSSGAAMPVTIQVTRNRNQVSVNYLITCQGRQYSITAQYLYKSVGSTMTITLRSCQEMIQL